MAKRNSTKVLANSDKNEVAIMVFLVLNVIKAIIDIVSGAINIVKSIKNDFTASNKNNKKTIALQARISDGNINKNL